MPFALSIFETEIRIRFRVNENESHFPIDPSFVNSSLFRFIFENRHFFIPNGLSFMFHNFFFIKQDDGSNPPVQCTAEHFCLSSAKYSASIFNLRKSYNQLSFFEGKYGFAITPGAVAQHAVKVVSDQSKNLDILV